MNDIMFLTEWVNFVWQILSVMIRSQAFNHSFKLIFIFVFIDFEIDKILISYFKQVHIDVNIMKYLVPSFVNIPFLSKKSMWTSSNDSKLVASVVLLNYLDCTHILYLDIFLTKVNFKIKLMDALGHIQTRAIGFNFLSIRDCMIQTKYSTS